MAESPCEIIEYLGYAVLKDRTNTSPPVIPTQQVKTPNVDLYDTGIGVKLTENQASTSQAKPGLTQTKAEKQPKTEQKQSKRPGNTHKRAAKG